MILLVALFGCEPEEQEAPRPTIINSDRVVITAFISSASEPEQATLELLHRIQADHPERIILRIHDITDCTHGVTQWGPDELETVTIAFNDNITVSWGEGDDRRTICFRHPPGFAWTNDDLHEAIQAALRGELRPAEPEEAEGLRMIDPRVRGQSIRVGDAGDEVGQLIVNDQPVINITESEDCTAPGRRVAAAASVLEEALEQPFTPSQLSVRRLDGAAALMAGEEILLMATRADARAEDTGPFALAQSWHGSLRSALITAAATSNGGNALNNSQDPDGTGLDDSHDPGDNDLDDNHDSGDKD